MLVVAAILAGCNDEPTIRQGQDPLANASTISRLPDNVGPSDCDPASPTDQVSEGVEVQGTGSGTTTVWALLRTDGPAIPVGEPVEVWWHVTGSHGLTITVVSPNGEETEVTGVFPNPAAGWERPGDSWESSITFDTPGCWRINVTRGGRHGDIWIQAS
jgi:hypothetical protein